MAKKLKEFKLYRRYFEEGTHGTLVREDGSHVCPTVERPWLNNKPSVSCIPEGTYRIVPHVSPSKGKCYALISKELGVGIHEGLRTHVLIHKANVPSELEGCIAPGTKRWYYKDQWGVSSSGKAMDKLMKELNGEEAILHIVGDSGRNCLKLQ